MITLDTIQKPAPTKEQRPAPSPEPDRPCHSTSQPPPIQRRSSRTRGPARLQTGCQSIIEYGCTVHSCGPVKQQTPGRGPVYQIEVKWYDIIEAENEKMTPDCCSISNSKNTLLLLQIISVSTWPGNVLNRYKTYTIILFINSVDKLRNEFQDWVWWMKLTKKVCCLWTVENQLWNCGSSCLLQCAGPSGSERRVHESCNNFRANRLPLPQTNNQNLSICATMEADKSVGEEVNHITMFCFLSEK